MPRPLRDPSARGMAAPDPGYFHGVLAEQFVDRLKAALWVFDFEEKRILWANDSALAAWQSVSLEELRSRDLGRDMSASVKLRLNQYRDDFIARDASFSELWTLYPNDVPTTMQVVFRGIRLPDGQMAMLCEGTEAEALAPETLRSADALLHTSAMISLFRANGDQLYRNPAARIAYGAGPMTLDRQFADSGDLKAIERALERSGSTKRSVRMNTASGMRWHEVTVRSSKDAVTGEDSILVSEIDITDMKVAKRRLQDFADVSSDWFWEMDAELRFSYFSDRARQLSGTDIEATLGKRRTDIVLELDDNWRRHFDDLKQRRPFRDFRYAKLGCDGTIYHISISGVPVFDDLGVFRGYRGTGTNISEQVQAEQKIARQRDLETELAKEREINGLQRQFVSMVSHEFRTPLAIIDGSAQRLIRRLGKMTPERAGEAVHKIRRSVARLTELMESVLSAARLEEGRINYAPEPCNLNDIIREICESYSDVYPDHRFEMAIDDLPEQIIADPKLIRQVVSNLASNAVKYSPAGTTIHVHCSENADGGEVIVSVRDEGVGIPKNELSRLSDRFFRASTSTGIAGSGIGLHLVQHFIDMHGGRMEVDSIEGEGSTFTVRLPKQAA
ncbi:MAG: PAS domain-containing sensor histidine kinase [Pseudomonadota bacterium]